MDPTYTQFHSLKSGYDQAWDQRSYIQVELERIALELQLNIDYNTELELKLTQKALQDELTNSLSIMNILRETIWQLHVQLSENGYTTEDLGDINWYGHNKYTTDLHVHVQNITFNPNVFTEDSEFTADSDSYVYLVYVVPEDTM